MGKKSSVYKSEITDMEVGQTKDFPIEHMATIRVTASNLGAILRRQYTTGCSDDKSTYQVTRVS